MPRDRYPHVLAFVLEHPWAITPGALDTVMGILSLRVTGQRLTEEAIAARLAAAAPVPLPTPAPSTIAVIRVLGVMGHRMGTMQESSGGTSTERLQGAIRQAVNDPSVGAILLDIHSPGGTVFGVAELADTVFRARGRKPIVAVANAQAASAAYWLASQADELVVTPSGEVGSIGVLAVHEDRSAAAEAEGLRVTYVSAGRYKAEGQPYQPLDDAARAYLQGRADEYYAMFVQAVARGRGVAQKTVRDSFGEGRMVGSSQALALGMADRVEPIEATVARLAAKVGRRGGLAAEGPRLHVQMPDPGMPETCPPDEDGDCPEGYEMGEDGMCHLAPAPGPEEGPQDAQASLDLRRRRLRLAGL